MARRRHRAIAVLAVIVCVLCAPLLRRLIAPVEEEDNLTLVLTAYETEGLRPDWLRQILRAYASDEYADVVDSVILVWNAPDHAPPAGLPDKVKVVRAGTNSLNNRWLLGPKYARSGTVVVLDNDLLLSKSGVRCLRTVQQDHPDRLVGPFVRRREETVYVLDELISRSSPYNFVLPRALVGHSDLLSLYDAPELAPLRQYVDEQEAHCDDLLLNLAASNATGLPPLRVALPRASIGDFATYCSPLDRTNSAGLADQTDRWKHRSECLQHFLTEPNFDLAASPEEEVVAVCSEDGETYEFAQEVGLARWRSMSTARARDLCPDLLTEEADSSTGRTGLARELVEYCPELNPATTSWINWLVERPLCGIDGVTQDPDLLASARHQCGAWCIWDLRTSGKVGWRWAGDCFERFENGHPECNKWFYQRPRFNL
ncbi:hypothetical protein JCM10908_007052 [Rhodotorula pacifica]|uniref:uncharacterized protein n=1 Tax=Rhodotorula pacifica TaxID=1495444 RepID=UPI00316B994F